MPELMKKYGWTMLEKFTPVRTIRLSSAIAISNEVVNIAKLIIVWSVSHRNLDVAVDCVTIPCTGNNPMHWAEMTIGRIINLNFSVDAFMVNATRTSKFVLSVGEKITNEQFVAMLGGVV